MALLLPFYILKIRKELEKTKDSEKRKALSKKLEAYVVEISQVLKKCVRNNYITDRDAAMLLRRLLGMNLELYGGYREFKEVNMNKRFEKLVDPDFCERWDRAIAEKAAKEAAKITAKVTAEVTAKVTAKVERRSLKQGLTQTAKNMLARGYSVADIIGITNLSREQIKALR
jgi:SOS response regulatory protein OraA/RecX